MKPIEIFGWIYSLGGLALFFAGMYFSWQKAERQKREMMKQHGKPRGQFN